MSKVVRHAPYEVMIWYELVLSEHELVYRIVLHHALAHAERGQGAVTRPPCLARSKSWAHGIRMTMPHMEGFVLEVPVDKVVSKVDRSKRTRRSYMIKYAYQRSLVYVELTVIPVAKKTSLVPDRYPGQKN